MEKSETSNHHCNWLLVIVVLMMMNCRILWVKRSMMANRQHYKVKTKGKLKTDLQSFYIYYCLAAQCHAGSQRVFVDQLFSGRLVHIVCRQTV